jgi:phage-related protein
VLEIDRRCRRELDDLPMTVREDLADAVARLDQGLTLSMPLSRPMPSIGTGVHELRLDARSGAFRVIYAVVTKSGVVLLHAFKKTSEKTPQRHIEIARERLKEFRR